MANNLDPSQFGLSQEEVDQFLGVKETGTQVPAQAQQQAPTAPVESIDPTQPKEQTRDTLDPSNFGLDTDSIQKFMQDTVDPVTGDVRPKMSRGLDPSTPINKSPVSVADRFKLAMGDEKGKIKYLKANYEDAIKAKDGSLLVKSKGLWHRVDPNGLGSGDPWDYAKEFAKDAVDLTDIASNVGGSIAGGSAGALAGAKAGAVAGSVVPGVGTLAGSLAGAVGGYVIGSGAGAGAGEVVNTAMGKIVGTYDAPPEDAAKEVAMETLLNMGGAAIPFAMKPTAGVMGAQLAKAGRVLKRGSTATKDVLAQVFGATSGAGADNVARYLARPLEVAGRLKSAAAGGAQSDKVISKLKLEMVDDVGQMARRTRSALTKMYQEGIDGIKARISPKFFNPMQKAANSTLESLSERGFLVKRGNEFKIKPMKELAAGFQSSGEITEIASDKKAYGLFNDYVKQLQAISRTSTKSGKEGLDQMVKMDQAVNRLTDKFTKRAYNDGLNETAKAIKELKAGMVNSADEFAEGYMDSGTREAFRAMKSKYNKVSSDVEFLTNLNTKAIKGSASEVQETALNKLLANTGRNEAAKGQLATAVEELGRFDKGLQVAYDRIQDGAAAQAFTPRIRSSFVQFGLIGGGVGSIASGNLGPMGATAGLVAATSPRLTMRGLGAGQKAAQTFVKASLMGKNFLNHMGPKQLNSFIQNDDAVRLFTQSLVNSPAVEQQAKEQIMGPLR